MTNAASRILIVDDEPSLLKMVSVYLGRLGYAVVTAGSTEEAWAEVEAAPHAFALAVLDATMSGIRMEDLAARILAADPRVCVIAAKAIASTEQSVRWFQKATRRQPTPHDQL